MRLITVLYLKIAISIFFLAGCNNGNSNTATVSSSPASIHGNNEFSNIALYHYAKFNSEDKFSLQWLKDNNEGLHHLGNFLYYANGLSLKWLKEYNPGLYYYAQFLMGDSEKSSLEWLKENNKGLYHLGNLLRSKDKSSLKWLQENNEGFYHLGNFMAYGEGASLQWLKEN